MKKLWSRGQQTLQQPCVLLTTLGVHLLQVYRGSRWVKGGDDTRCQHLPLLELRGALACCMLLALHKLISQKLQFAIPQQDLKQWWLAELNRALAL